MTVSIVLKDIDGMMDTLRELLSNVLGERDCVLVVVKMVEGDGWRCVQSSGICTTLDASAEE